MAEVNEFYAKRTLLIDGASPYATREYVIKGVDAEQAALDAMLASGFCPATVTVTFPDEDGGTTTQTLSRTRMEVEEIVTPPTPADYHWRGTVRYSLPTAASGSGGTSITWTQAPDIRWTFSMYTESTTQKVALFGQTKFGSGPDVGSLICATTHEGIPGEPEGAPVLVPAGVLRGSKTFTASAWNTVVSRAKACMCHVNSGGFSAAGLNFNAGELLMVGSEARMDSDRNVEVEFQFLYQPNSSGEIDGIGYHKGGWQYLWACTNVVNTASGPARAVKGLYAATMYDSADFGDFFASVSP